MVPRFTVPLTAVAESEVSGMLPDADMLIDFEPSALWSTTTSLDTASTHAFSVMVNDFVALFVTPFMDMENVPVPDVA